MKIKGKKGYESTVWAEVRHGLYVALVVAVCFASGCTSPTNPTTPAAYTTYLYMTDTSNGRVYTYDPATHKGSTSSLVTTSSNAAGEIKFYKGIGYVAMGTGGVYYFDPSTTAPTAKVLNGSSSVDAQYFAFYSVTKAFVSSFGTGVYTFNPSSLGNGLSNSPVSGTNGFTMQEIILGSDGFLYAADYGHRTVLRIDAASDSVTATFTASAYGTTGLAFGTYNGTAGVFVANTGTNPATYASGPGSIDFIPYTAASGATVQTVVAFSAGSPIYPGRVIPLSTSTLAVTGYGHTYLVALSGTTAIVTEVKAGTGSFGSLSLAASNGLIYVPVDTWNTSNQLYVFSAAGGIQQSYSPVSVMTSLDNIANVAFYQN